MAVGSAADVTLYETQFHTAFTETIQQNVNAFNAASNGAIVLNARDIMGNYEQSTFYTEVAGLITRRDINSVAAITPDPMADAENVTVKINRRTKLMSMTRDSFVKKGRSVGEMAVVLGQQYAEAAMQDYINTALAATRAALVNNAGVFQDDTTLGGTPDLIDHLRLIATKQLFGDASNRIRLWVMHSAMHTQLLNYGITGAITNVADVVINNGTIATLGAPTLVIDAPGLEDLAATPDVYYTLGLTDGAVTVTESEERFFDMDRDVTLENTALQWKAEWAYNLGIKGYAWDIANGGANPNDATLATGSNWDKVATDDKSTAGVVLGSDVA
jgi:hypothetical protein